MEIAHHPRDILHILHQHAELVNLYRSYHNGNAPDDAQIEKILRSLREDAKDEAGSDR